MLKQESQADPQQGLSDQVGDNARDQNRKSRLLPISGISDSDQALYDDRNTKSLDHCLRERRTRNTIPPMTRANIISMQIQAMTRIMPLGVEKGIRLNCVSTSKSTGRMVTVYFDSNPAVLKISL